MDKKTATRYAARINKAKSSFSVMGDMLLTFEIDAMDLNTMIEMRDALLNRKNPVSYKYLNERIQKLTSVAV